MKSAPASCARAGRSPGSPMASDTTAGSASSPIAKASSENGRRVWLTAKGRSVRARSSASMARSRSGATSEVPMLPSAPASQTAAVSSTLVHGPSEACTIGTSRPSRSVKAVRMLTRTPPGTQFFQAAYALRSERPAASSWDS